MFSLTGNYNHVALSAKDVFYILYTRAEEIKKHKGAIKAPFIPYFCDITDAIHFTNLCYEEININRMFTQIARLLEMQTNDVMGLPRFDQNLASLNTATITSTWSGRYHGNIHIESDKED